MFVFFLKTPSCALQFATTRKQCRCVHPRVCHDGVGQRECRDIPLCFHHKSVGLHSKWAPPGNGPKSSCGMFTTLILHYTSHTHYTTCVLNRMVLDTPSNDYATLHYTAPHHTNLFHTTLHCTLHHALHYMRDTTLYTTQQNCGFLHLGHTQYSTLQYTLPQHPSRYTQ